jgi:hypothetical protein
MVPVMRSRPPGLFLACLALAGAGCVTTNFVPTDGSFRSSGRSTRPQVFVDRLPPRPYRSVGIIEVTGPAGLMDLQTVMAEAAIAGDSAGCDVVVDRAIHRVGASASPAPVGRMLVQYIAPYSHPSYVAPQPAAPAYTPPPSRHEFICGVFVAASPAAPVEEPPAWNPPPPT